MKTNPKERKLDDAAILRNLAAYLENPPARQMDFARRLLTEPRLHIGPTHPDYQRELRRAAKAKRITEGNSDGRR
jgi:hypothetical protein